MSYVINTNISAMNAHRLSTNNNYMLDNSLRALSSGLQINKSADDASGLAISNKLSAQSNGLEQAISNTNDAIGLIQTADGALQEYEKIFIRLRNLSIQGANDTLSDEDRLNSMKPEMDKLWRVGDSINDNTVFNGKNILDGTHNGDGTFNFHVGAYSNDTISITISATSMTDLMEDPPHFTQFAANTQAIFESYITSMDTALDNLAKKRSLLGAVHNQLESNIRNISVTQINVKAAESQIRDVDFAAESSNFAKHNILAQSGSYALSQANSNQQNVMRFLQ